MKKELLFNESILEDANMDDLFIAADRAEREADLLEEIMMELMGENSPKIMEEEFAEYEIISSTLAS